MVSLRRRRKRQAPPVKEQAQQQQLIEDSTDTPPRLADPLISSEVWNSLQGDEFQRYPSLVDDLARMGEQVARTGMPEWMDWKDHTNADSCSLEDGDILAWKGRAMGNTYRGSELPIVKTQAIIPHASPAVLADLLMDSSRVQTYNPWSVGRIDVWVKPHNGGSDDNSSITKIVRNKTQPPYGGKPLIATTLLHQRKLKDNDAILVVSRAVGGPPPEPNVGVSDILLGVNLLEPHGNGNGTLLTAVTHVYSSAIPTLLAQRVAVKSAKQFVEDLRKATAPSAKKSTKKALKEAAETAAAVAGSVP